MQVTPHFHPTFGRGQRQASSAYANKQVLFALDTNGTLLPWIKYGHLLNDHAVQETAAVLEAPNVRNKSVVGILTGRAFTGAKHKDVRRFYDGVPVDFFAPTNGFRLFINHHNTPTATWLGQLSLKDEDPCWKTELKEQHNWDLDLLGKTRAAVLKQAGFRAVKKHGYKSFDETRTLWGRPSPKNPHYRDTKALANLDYNAIPDRDMLLVSFHPDGTSAMFEKYNRRLGRHFKLNEGSVEAKYADALAIKMHERLSAKGMVCKRRASPYRDTILHDFIPTIGDGKKILLRHLLANHLPNVSHVITAGDASTDDEYLTTQRMRFETPTKRSVSFHPIHVGNNPYLKQRLAKHPYQVHVESGQLAHGLIQQLQHIGPNIQLDTAALSQLDQIA